VAVDSYDSSEIDPVLRALVGQWSSAIEQAKRHKSKFASDAQECLQFYSGPRDWDELMGSVAGMGDGDGFPSPDFKMSVNKAFEFVTIFGPAMYHANPVRTVRPRMPIQIPPEFFPDPYTYQSLIAQEDARVRADGLRGVVLEGYLNWTPKGFDLSGEARTAIDEALIKGRGCLWTELYRPPASNFNAVRSCWESVDDLLVDPDATSMKRASWIARRRVLPVWQVERDYGLRRGSLRGNHESQSIQAMAEVSSDVQYDRKRGYTNDLITIYQVWSKMGLGGRLAGMRPSIRAALEPFGDNCFLVISPDTPFPLNLHPDMTNDPSFATDPSRVFRAVEWPTPFWASDGWPVSVLDFHGVHNSPWPMPHLKAGLGELKFLNWVMSFLMGRIRTSCRDFIALKKSLGEDIKTTILEGKDFSLLELESEHGTISELIQFLQHPEVNGDVWRMIEAVENNFDKRVGLTELMYGQGGSTQIRSAAEVSLRNQNMSIRPEDMASQVEGWMSEIAAKEALAARYHLTGQDVAPLLGSMGAWAWDQFVATQDYATAARQLEYSVESGSSQRPNKQWESQAMTEMFNAVGPVVQAYSTSTGDVEPINNLISDMAKSRQLDPSRYIMRAAIPPPPAPVPGQEATEEPPGQQNQPGDGAPI
jgi:hypothetical protein